MLFSSPTFFIFFLVYLCFHVSVPLRYRNYLIICGSTVFYSWWNVAYAWVPYLLAAIAYCGMLSQQRATDPQTRKRGALVAVALLFVPLIVFKYADFLYNDVFGAFGGTRDDLLKLPLPLGVSFITFTLTALVVDIYRGRFPAKIQPSTLLSYVLFFPHLIAGPILRPAELIPQLERPRGIRYGWIRPAVAILTLGLVKKLVFADSIAEMVDAVYRQPGIPSAPEALLGLYGFSVQIYCDFSGYTDMAIGLALLLGVRLPNNFARPYAAASPVEFWRRWHITLSFWLRDYLYFSLGGSRLGFRRQIVNLFVTMVLGGLWHGANWTFVVWGALHGAGIALVHSFRRSRLSRVVSIPSWLGVLITFHFVTLAWVFFRAPNLHRAVEIMEGLGAGSWEAAYSILNNWIFPLCLMMAFFLYHRYDDNRRVILISRRFRPEIFWPLIAVCWTMAITISQGSSQKFVYFDF
jgi:alginate O-acetyltransferase complex protein AlgI